MLLLWTFKIFTKCAKTHLSIYLYFFYFFSSSHVFWLDWLTGSGARGRRRVRALPAGAAGRRLRHLWQTARSGTRVMCLLCISESILVVHTFLCANALLVYVCMGAVNHIAAFIWAWGSVVVYICVFCVCGQMCCLSIEKGVILLCLCFCILHRNV